MSHQLHFTMSGKVRREEDRLERLVARCGLALHMVPDTLLLAKNIRDHHPPAHQAGVTTNELRRSVSWLCNEPLMTALQAGRTSAATVQCQHCQPSEPLTMLSMNYSGSSDEGLYDLHIGEGDVGLRHHV